jgi:hypothetical protein
MQSDPNGITHINKLPIKLIGTDVVMQQPETRQNIPQ